MQVLERRFDTAASSVRDCSWIQLRYLRLAGLLAHPFVTNGPSTSPMTCREKKIKSQGLAVCVQKGKRYPKGPFLALGTNE